MIVTRETNENAVLEFHLFCLCWGFTAQSTQWGHVERGVRISLNSKESQHINKIKW